MAGENNNNELTLESLAAQVAQLNEKIDSQDGTIKDQATAIAQLKKENAALKKGPEAAKPKEKPTIPAEPVSYNGKQYKFTIAQFSFKGKTVTALDAFNDDSIIAALVEAKSGVLQEVE